MSIPFLTLLIIAALSTIITFLSQRKQLLMVLLSLEGTILILAFSWPYMMSHFALSDLFLCVTILTMGACEASLALSILVSISRSFGNNMLSITTINKC